MSKVFNSHLINPNMSEDLRTKINSCVTFKIVKKGTVLQIKGDRVVNEYYVRKGLLRSYTIDEKGKEHIFMFASEDWLMSDIESQVFNKTAELYIDALEDTEIELIDSIAFRKIDKTQYFNENDVGKLLKRVAVLQRRVLLLMSATAMDRYENFIETYPDIVQRIPQKMIASYLGITPEGLSKLRRQRVKLK